MAVNTIRTQKTLFASLRPAGRQRQSMTLLGEMNGLRVVHCPQVRCGIRGVQMPTGSRAVRLPAAHQHLLSVA